MITNGNGKHGGGRPPIKIDLKELEKLCAMQCTLTEIAEWFHCSIDTIENRVKQEFQVSFSEYFSKKRVQGKITLRRNMFKMSEHNPAVAIFLAKNWLEMSDRQEVTGPGGGPVKHEVSIKVVSQEAKDLTQKIISGEGTG